MKVLVKYLNINIFVFIYTVRKSRKGFKDYSINFVHKNYNDKFFTSGKLIFLNLP